MPPLMNTKRLDTTYVPIIPQAMLAKRLPTRAFRKNAYCSNSGKSIYSCPIRHASCESSIRSRTSELHPLAGLAPVCLSFVDFLPSVVFLRLTPSKIHHEIPLPLFRRRQMSRAVSICPTPHRRNIPVPFQTRQ